jgi:hypothetical protein
VINEIKKELGDFSKNLIKFSYIKTIIISMIIIFLFLWGSFVAINIWKSNILEIIKISINMEDTTAINSVSILRISPKGSIVEVEKNNKNIWIIDKLCKGFRITLTKESLEKLKEINILIGNTKFTYTKDEFLQNWQSIKIDETILKSANYTNIVSYESPKNLSVNKSILPYASKLINWPGLFKLLFYTINWTFIKYFVFLLIIFNFSLIYIKFLIFRSKNNPAEKINVKTRIFTSVIVSAFFSFTLILFGTSQIYLNNVDEFAFTYFAILPILLIASLSFIFIITIIFSFFKSTIFKETISLLLMISFLFWLQGNVIVWKYGLLDGKNILWENYFFNGIADSFIWIFLIFLSIITSTFLYKYAKKIAAFFIFIQFGSIVILLFQLNSSGILNKYYLDDSKEFSFSKQKNVIVLILDAFQTDVFQEIINKEPEYKNMFDGFTYFRNSLGGFPVTTPSIPVIFTGKYYDNSIPFVTFFNLAYITNSLPKTLKENKYDVETFTNYGFSINDIVISNLKKGASPALDPEITGYLFDVTLFRYLPHYLKKYIYNDQKWSLKSILFNYVNNNFQDKIFIDKMLSNSKIDIDENAFKYYHLHGVHLPLVHDENFKYNEMPFNRENYIKSAEGSLKMTKLFLDKLKNLGIYDNTLIYIIGDHGAGWWGLNVNEEAAGYKNNGVNPLQMVKASAVPLILAKRINSKGEMKTSNAPVSLEDIPKTILSELGVSGNFPGKSMFEIGENEKRIRNFYFFYNNEGNNGYVYPITEYEINGFSWLDESWHATGRILNPANSKK